MHVLFSCTDLIKHFGVHYLEVTLVSSWEIISNTYGNSIVCPKVTTSPQLSATWKVRLGSYQFRIRDCGFEYHSDDGLLLETLHNNNYAPLGTTKKGTKLVWVKEQHPLLRDQRQGGHQCGTCVPEDRQGRSGQGEWWYLQAAGKYCSRYPVGWNCHKQEEGLLLKHNLSSII